jgi:hypothetical protein
VLDLIALVVSIGIVDSLNPSTIGPAAYLATARNAHSSLVGFALGVFGTNLAAGLALTLGPGQLLLAAIPHVSRHTKHLIELGLGVVALALAIVLWRRREQVAHTVRVGQLPRGRSSLALGAGIVAVELPTAFPYFAVIAAIVGSGVGVPTQIVLVVLFNALFVAPVLAIVVMRRLAGARANRWLEAVRQWIDERAAQLLPAVVLAAATALIAVGGIGVIDG